MSGLSLALASTEVIGVRGERGVGGDDDVVWYLDYAPEPENDPLGRVLFSTIHAVNDGIATDVTVAAFCTYHAATEPTSDEFEAALTDSPAAEMLWDVTRICFGSVAGLLGAHIELARKAPIPTFGVLTRPDEKDEGAGEAS